MTKGLPEMLSKQYELQASLYGAEELSKIMADREARVAYIKEHSIHLNQEINEMLYELPHFKPWKDYAGMGPEAQEVAFQKARCEMIDAWHFFMNIMLALGFSPYEFVGMYFDKHAENLQRQEDHYTWDKSYRRPYDNIDQITFDHYTNGLVDYDSMTDRHRINKGGTQV